MTGWRRWGENEIEKGRWEELVMRMEERVREGKKGE